MIGLTDEEIRQVPAPVGDIEYERAFCKAQLKKVVERLGGNCPHKWEDFGSGEKLPVRERRHCPKCWQALQNEVVGDEKD